MTLSHSPNIVRDGLVLYLDAANPISYSGNGNTWNNLVNKNSSFTLINSPVYDGSSFLFDGVNDYAQSISSSFLKWQNWDKLSINLTFKHISSTGQTNNRQYLLDFRNSGGVNGALGLLVDNPSTTRELTLFYNTVGTSYEEPTITTYNFNEWISYTLTFDKTSNINNIRHYINGENVFNRSVTANSTTVNSGDSIWIGRYFSGNYSFNGKISNFSAYTNKILTPQEIKQNFNALRGRYGI